MLVFLQIKFPACRIPAEDRCKCLLSAQQLQINRAVVLGKHADGVMCSLYRRITHVLHELHMQLMQIQLSNRLYVSTPGREIKK